MEQESIPITSAVVPVMSWRVVAKSKAEFMALVMRLMAEIRASFPIVLGIL